MKANRYSCQFLMKLEFSGQIFKNTQISNTWKSVQWELTCSVQQADGPDKHDTFFVGS
jgi:hypothetical protein